MLNEVDIVLFQALWQVESNLLWTPCGVLSRVFFLVLNSGDLMVSDKLSVFFIGYSEVVIAHSTFVGNLMRNKLRVVPCWDALVYQLLLAL